VFLWRDADHIFVWLLSIDGFKLVRWLAERAWIQRTWLSAPKNCCDWYGRLPLPCGAEKWHNGKVTAFEAVLELE